MAFLNKVLLIGNLTRDPEVQYLTSGTALCKFDIAINRRMKDKDETVFVKIETWGKTAEFCKQYFKQGRPIFVEGRLKTEQWEAKDGTKRKQLLVVAEQLGFADSRSSSQSDSSSGDDAVSEFEPNSGANNGNTKASGAGEQGVSDDIPF